MKKIIYPQDQNFWYLQRPDTRSLHTNQETDVVILGGGMAGLTAAHAFAKKGKKVILLEAHYCGAGASGKSSGFIEPNGEISLSEFIEMYGTEGAQAIWGLIQKYGMEYIRNNIKQYQFDCDYIEEDSLEVASSAKDVVNIRKEAENLARFGYTTNFITKEDIAYALGTKKYYGGVTYPNTFGISAYKYCQAMKHVLQKEGVEIYEETPALHVQEHLVTTLHATVKAQHIIICADRFIPTLDRLTKEIYHVQNFLLISEVLTPEVIQKLFPQKRWMVWDTELIYNFYRITGDRLLIGGGSVLNVYNAHASHHSPYMYKKLTHYINSIFPNLTIHFEQMWPGLIGVSKDIAPITGPDKDMKSIYYIGAAAGLPIAAMLGNYCADYILDGDDTLKDYFSPYRQFPIHGALQTVLGTKLTFAISNFMSHGNT